MSKTMKSRIELSDVTDVVSVIPTPPIENQLIVEMPLSIKGKSARHTNAPASATYFAVLWSLFNAITSSAASKGSKSTNGVKLPPQLREPCYVKIKAPR